MSRGGEAQGAWGPPPRNWKAKKKKKKKKVIRANLKPFYLYFANFLVEIIIFSATFWAGPPREKLEKKSFQILGPPPPLTNSWTRAWTPRVATLPVEPFATQSPSKFQHFTFFCQKLTDVPIWSIFIFVLCVLYLVEYTFNPNLMIEIAPELWPWGHCSSPTFVILCKNLDYKPQSINHTGLVLRNVIAHTTIIQLFSRYMYDIYNVMCT